MTLLLSLFIACGNQTGDTAETPIEISNAGPNGSSHMENSCGPTDGYALALTVGITESEECLGEVDPNFSVVLLILGDSIESGTKIPLLSEQVQFNYEDTVEFGVDGEVDFNFEGEWQEGTEFTGFYWVELEDGLIIEGGFEGVFCGGEAFCG